MKILLVEDEESIQEVEKAYLERAGHDVDTALDGAEALEKFKQEEYDLVVLDLNLPEISGLQVCRRIRLKSDIPIIMVTAKTDELDEITGLEYGADDYIKKPFSPNILVTRVETLLRRAKKRAIEIEDIVIDPEKVKVLKNNQPVELTATQFNLLYTLAQQPGKVFSRQELLKTIYENNTIAKETSERTIDAHVKDIRKTLGNGYITTVIGKGYKIDEA